MKGAALPKADLAASFRRAVCSQLTETAERALRALPGFRIQDLGFREDETAASAPAGGGSGLREKEGTMAFALAGGVSANRELRRMAAEMCARLGVARLTTG